MTLIENIFTLESLNPFLIQRKSDVSVLGYRWGKTETSYDWAKLASRANQKLLTLAKQEMQEQKIAENDDKKIATFLNHPRTRWQSLFSQTNDLLTYEQMKKDLRKSLRGEKRIT